jgi:hypothetical protein
MDYAPINNAFLQSLLRAIGLVELDKAEQLEKLDTRAKGVWSLPWPASTSTNSWLFAPLAVSEKTLTSKAGRIGLHDALTVVLPRDKVMSPDAPAVGLVTGLGTWHSFHEKLPVDLVVEELDDRLRLGIGARFPVEDDGKPKPRLVALARLCEVAVGPTGATLARPCEPLELQATLTGAGPFKRVGLGATFSLSSNALDARLLVVDVDDKERSARFPQELLDDPDGPSAIVPPIHAALLFVRAWILGLARTEEAEQKKAGKTDRNALPLRLVDHLFPLVEGGKITVDGKEVDNPIPAMSLGVLAGRPKALLAWLKGLMPALGKTIFDVKLDAAAAALCHLRALLFGVALDEVKAGSCVAWAQKLSTNVTLNPKQLTGLLLENLAGEVGLGVRSRIERSAGPNDNARIALEIDARFLETAGEGFTANPSVNARLVIEAAVGGGALPGGFARVEAGLSATASSFQAIARVSSGTSAPPLTGDAAMAALKQIGLDTSWATGVLADAKKALSALFGNQALETVTSLAQADPKAWLQQGLGLIKSALGFDPLGGIAVNIGLPDGSSWAVALDQGGVTLTLPSSGPLTGSAHAGVDGSFAVSVGLTLPTPTELPISAALKLTTETGDKPFSLSLVLGATSSGKKITVPLLGGSIDTAQIGAFVDDALGSIVWPAIRSLDVSVNGLSAKDLLKSAGILTSDEARIQVPALGLDAIAGLARKFIDVTTLTIADGPTLAAAVTPTEVGLKLSKLVLPLDPITVGAQDIALTILSKGSAGWAFDPKLTVTPYVSARGPLGEPLFQSDFLQVDSIDADVSFDLLPAPRFLSANAKITDLRLPFGRGAGGGIESGLFAGDGKNPGMSFMLGWDGLNKKLTLAFPDGKAKITFRIDRQIGPLDVRSLGCEISGADKAEDISVQIKLDAEFSLGGVHVHPEGLGVTIPLAKLDDPSKWSVGLDGLSLWFQQSGVTLAGLFAKKTSSPNSVANPAYVGKALVSAFGFQLGAIGAYEKAADGSSSLFVFATTNIPLGGPPFFFVTGVAGGFGVNRGFDRPASPRLLKSHPLLSLMGNSDPGAGLDQLVAALPARAGAYWLAGGVNFSSFVFITGSALVYVLLDHGLEIGVLALAHLEMAGLAQVNLAIDAGLSTRDEPTLWAKAELYDSWVLCPGCELTGGFAFQVWPRLGDCVLTIGGYGPLFKKPARYPSVEAVGFRWQPTSSIVVKGGAYFALTPREAMAGGSLEVSGSWGPVSAGFNASVDGLIRWDPFFFHVNLQVGVWGALGSLKFEVGVGLRVHGPPIGGVATIKLLVISVDIPFGDSSDPPTDPVPLGTFLGKHLGLGATPTGNERFRVSQPCLWGREDPPASAASAASAASDAPSGSVLALSVASGKQRGGDGKAGADENKPASLPTEDKTPVRLGSEFTLELASRIPLTQVIADGFNTAAFADPEIKASNAALSLAPVRKALSASTLTLTVPADSTSSAPVEVKPLLAWVPKALFGTPDAYKDAADSATSAATTLKVVGGVIVDATARLTPAFHQAGTGAPQTTQLSKETSTPKETLDLPFFQGETWSAYAASANARVPKATAPKNGVGPKVGSKALRPLVPLFDELRQRPIAWSPKPALGLRTQARPAWSMPKRAQAIGVAFRALSTAAGEPLAFLRTTVAPRDDLRRMEAPAPAARRIEVVGVALHVAEVRPTRARAPVTPRRATMEALAAIAREQGTDAVVPLIEGGARSEALRVAGGDALLLAAGEAALFDVARRGTSAVHAFVLGIAGDQRVRLLALDACSTPLEDSVLAPGEQRRSLPEGTARVLLLGLGRPALAAPPASQGHRVTAAEITEVPEIARRFDGRPSRRDIAAPVAPVGEPIAFNPKIARPHVGPEITGPRIRPRFDPVERPLEIDERGPAPAPTIEVTPEEIDALLGERTGLGLKERRSLLALMPAAERDRLADEVRARKLRAIEEERARAGQQAEEERRRAEQQAEEERRRAEEAQGHDAEVQAKLDERRVEIDRQRILVPRRRAVGFGPRTLAIGLDSGAFAVVGGVVRILAGGPGARAQRSPFCALPAEMIFSGATRLELWHPGAEGALLLIVRVPAQAEGALDEHLRVSTAQRLGPPLGAAAPGLIAVAHDLQGPGARIDLTLGGGYSLRALAVVPGSASSALRDFLADPLRDPVGAEGGVTGSSRFSLEAP